MRAPRSLVLISAVLVACGSSSQTTGQCKTDSNCATGQFCNAAGFCQTDLGCTVTDAGSGCPNGQSCDSTSGECFCTADTQCPSGQTCNQVGRCAVIASCQTNQDCTSTQICNTATHDCIPQGTCAQDIQCPQGQICTNGACVAGCVNDGDCVLVDYSQVPPVYEPAACINFTCVPNGCHSDVNCPIFSACLTSAGQSCPSASTECTCDTLCGTSQFCESCNPSQGSGNCPHNGLCLVDPSDPATCGNVPTAQCKFFCGIDCSSGQTCPNGTVCYTITGIGETSDVPGGACNVGDTCNNSKDGQPNAPCPVEEGAESGSCPCFKNSDCPSDGLENLPCEEGACVVGAQCAPDKQYSCQTNTCGAG